MKPLIILTDCDKEGYIRIKKEEFEKIIQTAYEEGKKDGRVSLTTVKSNELNITKPYLGRDIDVYYCSR